MEQERLLNKHESRSTPCDKNYDWIKKKRKEKKRKRTKKEASFTLILQTPMNTNYD